MPTRPRPRTLIITTSALTALLTAVPAGSAAAEPPDIPDADTARTELAGLTVAGEGGMSGYSREKFPHWESDGDCTTRQTVLARDGEDVETGDTCQPVSGSWYSPYDDTTRTSPSDVDIDHVVPLAEAWRSGADGWTTDERRDFANDLEHPQLIAVSDTSNSSKGDQDPADWQPVDDYHCTYARMWVDVKHEWGLTVDTDEKAALEEMLGTC
ncbi:HNH endonuclease family protein [Streptomyces sp. RFCAC02]|uniref:HNH endonuclease family protein n=1 Tax=Streptomyces sp. RFCAC02 TaxID=2499143 RepID=UPI0010204E00|nr:HNH endonuclease family protein [Streptomyces sp. RFCAC02]